MRGSYYEIHVTLEEDAKVEAQLAVWVIAGKWAYSKIDGDPDLGKGTRYYRTAHANSLTAALQLVIDAQQAWPSAIRYKIEEVLLDIRK